MRAALLVVVLGACDPIWGVNAQLRDVSNRPVEDATLAVACPAGYEYGADMAVHSDKDGRASVGGLGAAFPVGCDIFIAKPGYRTQRVRYGDICPAGPDGCDRVFHYDLVLEPY